MRVCEIVGDLERRDFDLGDDVDIWQVRRVRHHVAPIPILDFHGVLKGRLLGPRLSIWGLRPSDLVARIGRGEAGLTGTAADPAAQAIYQQLRELTLARLDVLQERDWEDLVADFFRAQGAHVDENRVGGSQALIDLEATFSHGELGDVVWRAQVKRYQNKQVDWPAIASLLPHVSAEDARFCFVSVYGFTDAARAGADAAEQHVRLLERHDFVRFVLTGKLRESLQQKLGLPTLR